MEPAKVHGQPNVHIPSMTLASKTEGMEDWGHQDVSDTEGTGSAIEKALGVFHFTASFLDIN